MACLTIRLVYRRENCTKIELIEIAVCFVYLTSTRRFFNIESSLLLILEVSAIWFNFTQPYSF